MVIPAGVDSQERLPTKTSAGGVVIFAGVYFCSAKVIREASPQ